MALIFLCGQKDCGKTYFLNLLKTKYSVTAFDLDEIMTEKSKSDSVRHLYTELGEEKFRAFESETFNALIKKLSGTNAAIALGGGAVNELDLANKSGKTVYLYENKNVLFDRMQKEGLPSFVKDEKSFGTLFEQRDNVYRKKCSKIIDLSKTGENEVCQILLEMYLN